MQSLQLDHTNLYGSLANHFPSKIAFLGFAYDNRLLMTEQAKELTGPEPMERLRLQTAQILDSSTRQIPDSLDRVVGQLTRTLDAHLAAHG